MKKIAAALLLVVLTSSLGLISAKANDEVGAPDFTLTDVNDKKVSLSDFKGKPVFLNFFATWCPPCMREMPMIADLARENPDVQFILVSVDQNKTRQGVVGILDAEGFRDLPNVVVLFDAPDFKVARAYGVGGIPRTLLIKRNGLVFMDVVGFKPWNSQEHKALIKDLKSE